MQVDNNIYLIGPRTIVFDSEQSFKPFVLGGWSQAWQLDWRFRERVDDSWWLVDFEDQPIYDELGHKQQVARFEIGDDCRYRLSVGP